MSKLLSNGKLDNQEIRRIITTHSFSSGFRPTERLVDEIIETFWFRDFYNSFISDQVFLDFLIQYLDETAPTILNRYDFYQFLFNNIALERNDLHELARAFELHQTDRVKLVDYPNFVKVVNVTKKHLDTSWLQANHLVYIGKQEDKDFFIWHHHSLTEFLVAEDLLKQIDFLKAFEKLSIIRQEGIVAFKPSWIGVLRFLLESPRKTEVASWLVTFLETYPDNIDDDLSEVLTNVEISFTSDSQERIFNLIYNSYFERLVWLPVWVRQKLSKFVSPEIYQRLRHDIKNWPDETETFVKQGNVITIIEGLLKDNSRLLAGQEKSFWKTKLINFAKNKNTNGVLQRDSLAALVHFHDETIIPLVVNNFESADSLVRDAFIQFCFESSPNAKITVDYLMQGIKRGSTIYARLGLYQITTYDAIRYFLSRVVKDSKFLEVFLKHESLFERDESEDRPLIEHIKKAVNQDKSGDLVRNLQRVLFLSLKLDSYYDEEKSLFLRELTSIIKENDPNYLFTLLEKIRKSGDDGVVDRLFYDAKTFLAQLLSENKVKEFFEQMKKFPERTKRDAQYVIYTAKRVSKDNGELIYNKAVKLKLIKPVDENAGRAAWEQQQNERVQKIIKHFQELLEPSPGNFIPNVFENYLHNTKEFDEFFETKEGLKQKKRLIKLAVEEGIRKTDPRKFTVTIPDKTIRQFTWSSVASYYGDVLSIIKKFAPQEIEKHRQQIIDFIPFAFSDDMSLIIDLIPEVQEKELEFVNQVMLDTTRDIRYLIPGTYIYLAGHYAKKGNKLSNAKPILKSFVDDKDILDDDKRAAVENLMYFIDVNDSESKSFLQNLCKKSKNNEMMNAANALLISVYKDEQAIDWRFDKLKKPIRFYSRDLEGIAHAVGTEELEINSLDFAKPLIELRDEKYLHKFLDLISYSFKVLNQKRSRDDENDYWEFVNYLWRITIAYVGNLKKGNSFVPLLKLEKWVNENINNHNDNWLKAKIRDLRREYVNSIGLFKLKDKEYAG